MKHFKGWLALFIVLLLCGGIYNSFHGNPISAAISKYAMKAYIEQHYPTLKLELGVVTYNFKFQEYMGIARSPSSIDTHFAIYSKKGSVTHDDYESYVIGKFNTLTRFEETYTNEIIPKLAKLPGLEKNRAMVVIDNWEEMKSQVALDTPFSNKIPMISKLIVRLDDVEPSLEDVAKTLESVHSEMKRQGYSFQAYEYFSEYRGLLVMVGNVTPKDIENGNLKAVLEERKEQDVTSGISVVYHHTDR